MAWTAPMTAVAGSVFTATQFNQYVRDNLRETMTAQATDSGAHFAGNGTGDVIQRKLTSATVNPGSTTTATTYTDLASGAGPSVTLMTGTVAAVFLYCHQWNTDVAVRASWMSFEISGATGVSASDAFAVQLQGTAGQRVGAGFLVDNLTSGLNTFTAKYRVSTSGTGTFSSRRLAVWPF